MRFTIGKSMVDYLTISTFIPADHRRIVLWAVDSSEERGEMSDVSRRGYHGQIQDKLDGSFFWGEGEQKGMKHYLHQAGGSFSHRLCSSYLAQEWGEHSITRIDIQLTLPKPEWFKSRNLVDWLRDGDWPGRKRKVISYDAGGDDTVYIGSRQSDRYARVYVKDSDYLRCEFEYKGERAEAVIDRLRAFGIDRACEGILHRELLALPKHPVIVGFIAQIREKPIEPTVRRSESNRYKWFIRTVVPAVATLLNDHDSGERVRRILHDMLGQGGSLSD